MEYTRITIRMCLTLIVSRFDNKLKETKNFLFFTMKKSNFLKPLSFITDIYKLSNRFVDYKPIVNAVRLTYLLKSPVSH